ncbi:hypothetical protein [Sanguibacter sp. Z1732]|uniref:hypothetical protein n=1 Tax=Sanguibacter sp. Z1732 TaxID=3435412 RepID=UPI003D9C9C12
MSTPLASGARLVLAVVPVAALAALAALSLSGSAQAELLGDPGAWVRWGGPVLGAAHHLAAAVVLGTLVRCCWGCCPTGVARPLRGAGR